MSASNLFSLLQRNGGGISRSITSDCVNTAFTAVEAAIKMLNIQSPKIGVIPLDHTAVGGLAFSSLIITLVAGPKEVYFTTLLLASSADPLTPVTETINNITFQIPRFTIDAWDGIYAQEVDRKIDSVYPGACGMWMGTEVIQRDFNFKNERDVHAMLLRVLTPMATNVDGVAINGDFDLSKIDRGAEGLSICVQQAAATTDVSGNPVRADWKITTTAVPRMRVNERAVNQQAQPAPVCTVSGYCDVVYEPGPETVIQGVIQQSTLRFRPRIVITSIENHMNNTLQGYLLALATVSSLITGRNWWTLFIPRTKVRGGVDLRDPGVLNIEGLLQVEANETFGKPFDTASQSFSLDTLGDMLTKLFHQDPIVSLCVSRSGQDSLALNTLVSAAMGSLEASTTILKAAVGLTGGKFSEIFKSMQNQQPVIVMGSSNGDYPDLLHTGNFIDQNGIKHDLREIDYLAVMNLRGTTDPTLGLKWHRTFCDQSIPVRMQMAARLRIIEDVLSGCTVEVTGVERLVNLGGDFLRALIQGLGACQINTSVSINNPFVTYQEQRPVMGWSAQAAVGVNNLNYGATAQVQSYGNGGRYAGSSSW